jgi:Carboxypeptidase regulatory-like domain
MRFPASLALCLAALSLLAGSLSARAEDSAGYGATSSGLCGLVYTGLPVCGRGITVAASAGYGATFMQGRHDRGTGNLGVAVVPLDWLALSLELAGRIDAHPKDAEGKSVTATGEPTLRARAGMPIGRAGLRLGGELGLWLPGREAPSFNFAALTPDLKLLLAFQDPRWQLLGSLGVRIDQSYKSAPDLSRVRPGDRVTLGLSDSHALLLGFGVGYFVIPRMTVFGELSADVLLGKQAPAFLESPLRFAAGARYFVLPALQVELVLKTSLSQRPNIAVSDPLVPIEPRVAVSVGLRATFGAPKPRAAAKPVAVVPSAVAPEPPALGRVSGVLTDQDGAPLPEVTVKLLADGGPLETITDAQGRYSFEQLHMGKAELRADAAGFKSDHWDVEITGAETLLPSRALTPGESTGILRCLVRSYESTALEASISVRDARNKRVAGGSTDKNGSLEFALPPGQYRVMIEAAGYRSQRTQVQVAANEVAILNVDMRKIE